MGRGAVFTIMSAIFFGANPILARYTIAGGGTPVTMAFFRAIISIPVLLCMARAFRVSADLRGGFIKFAIGGALNGITVLLLYSSYTMIPAGMATTLHYVYPLAACIGGALMFGERMGPLKAAAVIMCTAGVALFASGDGMSSGGLVGACLAGASGITFALYLLYAEHGPLRSEHYIRITLAINIMLALLTGIYGASTGGITVDLDARAWACMAAGALLCGVSAVALLQIGIKLVGATSASILSTFEPITSMVLGVLLLGETMDLTKITAASLIIASVAAVARAGAQKGEGRR